VGGEEQGGFMASLLFELISAMFIGGGLLAILTCLKFLRENLKWGEAIVFVMITSLLVWLVVIVS
jgi:hypothetical protein